MLVLLNCHFRKEKWWNLYQLNRLEGENRPSASALLWVTCVCVFLKLNWFLWSFWRQNLGSIPASQVFLPWALPDPWSASSNRKIPVASLCDMKVKRWMEDATFGLRCFVVQCVSSWGFYRLGSIQRLSWVPSHDAAISQHCVSRLRFKFSSQPFLQIIIVFIS